MKKITDQMAVFEEQVAVRHRLYSSLLTTLPFGDLETVGSQLSLFTEEATKRLEQGESPVTIVEEFLTRWPEESRKAMLFKFLQIIERQVVLFDAIEDASFEAIHDKKGYGTLDSFLDRVIESDLSEKYAEDLANYRVRIVLTAHPTQFYPDPVLGVIRELSEAVHANDISQIVTLLFQLGQTKFRNKEKPTPLIEAHSVMWYLENNFYRVLPDIQKRAYALLPEDAARKLPALLEIGFWPGGDRDGNPFVTAETTLQVARDLKWSLLKLYRKDLADLKKRLTFDGIYQKVVAIHQKIQWTIEEILSVSETPKGYASAQEFRDDLSEIEKSIYTDYRGLFADHVRDLIDRVNLFGFHFAILDVRQDSRIHEAAVNDLMDVLVDLGTISADRVAKAKDDETARVELILDLINQPLPESFAARVDALPNLTMETVKSYDAVAKIQSQNGEAALHRSIISNSQAAVDLFEVFFLAHCGGIDATEMNLDVCPLFETIEDLHNAEDIMALLYSHPFYKAHLERRGNAQHIMLGYSDGTKDGGYLGANYGIYQAKQTLTRISRSFGVTVTFFDGRGGPPARGGGNTHRFYRSLGKNIDHEAIHLTIQGQTISSNFGTTESAKFNMEQMFTAGLESSLFHAEEGVMDPADATLLDTMAETARLKYLELKGDDLFVPYLEEMTPLRFYDRLNIGSRPVKRKSGEALKFEDLRAIPFVGSWSQIKQNIPGFYGLGTALASVRNNDEQWKAVKRLYRDNLFFQTLMDNAMQALSKTFLPLTAYLARDERFGSFWTNISEEAALTVKLLTEASNTSALLEREPVVKASIELREKTVLPLLVIQQYALDRVRAAEDECITLPEEEVESLRKLVVKSLAANINASRNSA